MGHGRLRVGVDLAATTHGEDAMTMTRKGSKWTSNHINPRSKLREKQRGKRSLG